MNEVMERDRFAAFLAQLFSGKGPNANQFSILRLEGRTSGNTAYLEVEIRHYPFRTRPPGLDGEETAKLQALIADERIEAFHIHVVQGVGVDVEFLAHDVPGVGYSQFSVVKAPVSAAQARSPQSRPSGAIRRTGSLRWKPIRSTVPSPSRQEDGHGACRCEPFRRRRPTGGDEYTFCPPERDGRSSTTAPCLPLSGAWKTPLGQSLEIGLLYRVPGGLAPGDRSSRSKQAVDLPVI